MQEAWVTLAVASLADGFLVDVPQLPKKDVEIMFELTGINARGRKTIAQCLQVLCELQRELNASQIQAALFDQVLHLAKPFDILIRVQTQVP